MNVLGFPVLEDSEQPQVHASTLLRYDDALIVAWSGGSKEGASDTKIWLSRFKLAPYATSWTHTRAVAEETSGHWNPVLFRYPHEEAIRLFYKTGSPLSQRRANVRVSYDLGRSWSEPHELVTKVDGAGGRGPFKNKPIVLEDGAILAPASVETPDGIWDCFVDRSTDGGKTWHRSVFVPNYRIEGVVKPSLVSSGGGKVTMLCGSSTGRVERSDSTDSGRTWSQMYETTLRGNNSGLDAVRSENGSWLVVHSSVAQNGSHRTPLVISKSIDKGLTWNQVVTLENVDPLAPTDKAVAPDEGIEMGNEDDGRGEFSHPAMISDGHGGVIVSYTYERRGVKVVYVHDYLLHGN